MADDDTSLWQKLLAGTDLDRSLTPEDIALWPGNYLLSRLAELSPESQLLRLILESYGGVLSVVLSAAAWLALIIAIRFGYEIVVAVDRMLTASVARLYAGTMSGARRVTKWIISACRELYRRLRQVRRDEPCHVECRELEDRELSVLRCYAQLPPGHVLTASDTAHELGMLRSQAERAIASLSNLQLLSRSFATCDGESAYALTRAGKVLAMRS